MFRVLLVLLSFLGLASSALAQSDFAEFGSPHYMLHGAFALQAKRTQRPEGGLGYRTATYLPHSTLVFIKSTERFPDLGQHLEIGHTNYVKAITQHGQKLFVPERPISDKRLDERWPYYRNSDKEFLFFHTEMIICPKGVPPPCANGHEIQPGYFVEVVEEYPNSVKLSFEKEKTFSGLIDRESFSEALNRGLITPISVKYPRYVFAPPDKKRIGRGAGCGRRQVVVDSSVLSGEAGASLKVPDWIPFLSGSVGAQALEEETVNITSTVEEANVYIENFIVEVTSLESSGNAPFKRKFGVGVVYRCSDDQLNEPVYIQEVAITEKVRDGAKPRAFVNTSIKFAPVHPGGVVDTVETGTDVVWVWDRVHQRPFLTSINHPDDYPAALSHWTQTIEDISIANIFLSLFNASCPDEHKLACRKRLPIADVSS